MAGAGSVGCAECGCQTSVTAGTIFQGYADPVTDLVSRQVVGDDPEKRRQRVGTATSAGARAMVRPGRDLLTGRVEVDECYVGGLEERLRGRLNLQKALIVVAAQEDGPGIGRIRMRQIVDLLPRAWCPLCRAR
jgi:hypothetical protein